jgi:hypothetical protein
MKNKNSLLLLLFLVVSAIAYFMVNRQPKDMLEQIDDPYKIQRDFAYPEFEKINYIYLKRPKYPLLVFRRKGNEWIINKRYPASEETMTAFINVLKRMELKYIPPNSMLQTIQDDIKKNGIEVKLYSDSVTLEKHYFVGSEFGDGTDTPVILAKGKQPFMMQLKGLDGSIRRRMNFDLQEWRSKVIFNENVSKIKKITVEYPQEPQSGFTLLKFNDEYKVLDYENKEITIKKPNQKTIEAYFDFYTNVRGESNETENPERKLIESKPKFAIIKIVSVDNLERRYYFTAMMDMVTDVKTTSPNRIDPDSRFFVSTYDKNFVLGQQRVIGKLFQSVWYFF